MERVCIYASDVAILTGKTVRSARRIIASNRKALNKKSHEVLSIYEFCSYMGLKESEVKKRWD